MSAVRIPDVGRGHDELLAEMESMRQGDVDWRGGRTWSMVYHGGDAHHAFLKQASNLFFSANGLNPLAFKSLKRMEAQVVRMSADMLHAPADAVGTMTSGGTESILMAVKAARDYARRTKPWIRRPEIVAPKTLHVAFDKACHYFGMRRRNVPVDENWRVDVKALEKAITRNTVLIAASAPQYVNGSVDPIEEIGAIAAKRRIPFHVDACFGGFILPWLEDLGHPVPVFDFRVPGVTSMSADVHKYGYAPKGSSVVIYRRMRLLRHQFFVTTDWPGGIYISPSMQGSRSGAMIAAAWASMMAMGRDGYRRLAGEAMAAANQLREGIAAIDGIEVLGLPHSTVVTWGASPGGPDVYAIADRMEAKGWSVDRQQHPASVHCTVNASNGPVVELYLSDLAEAVAYVRAHPEASREGDAALYGMMARVPVRGLVKEGVLKIMEQLYGPDSEEPDLSQATGGDDPMMALFEKYGERALDAWEKVRDRLPGRRRR